MIIEIYKFSNCIIRDNFFQVINNGKDLHLTKSEKKEYFRNKPTYMQSTLGGPVKKTKLPTRKRKLQSLKQADANGRKQRKTSKRNTPRDENNQEFFDIWGEDGANIPVLPNKPKVETSVIPAVEIPDQGISYNPDKKSHQKLIKKAVEVEKKKRLVKRQVNLAAQGGIKPKQLENINRKYDEQSSEEEEEPIPSDDEEEEKVNVAFVDRLTQTQRNRRKRQKLHEAEKLARKKQKEFNKQNAKLAIVEAEKKLEELKEREKQRQSRVDPATKRLGKEIFNEEIDVLLTEELPGSLRSLVPSDNLAKERFLSMQKRNIIEPRSRKDYERRYKVKYAEQIRHREYKRQQLEKYGVQP
eukprot:TRINITY_DN8819_c0_g1_i2.p1 TRINITY_DN8819_c0_g1~~TRINITY_DN8819_c0_g1_i2.p1  ORF type:complete len:356 (-),score=106.91 TRINITY_DN8819_c0_g1_i2:63-1130(-)